MQQHHQVLHLGERPAAGPGRDAALDARVLDRAGHRPASPGSTGITLVATGALAAVAASVGSPLDAASATRGALNSLRFAAALGSLAALVTAVVRSPAAVIALVLLVEASDLVGYLAPLFGWPDWLNRLSLFWAFGTPYVDWPNAARIARLLVVTVGGTVGAALAAERSPSVPEPSDNTPGNPC